MENGKFRRNQAWEGCGEGSSERRNSSCNSSKVGKSPPASGRSVWLRPGGPWRGRRGSGSHCEVEYWMYRRTMNSLTWCRVEHLGRTDQSGAALGLSSPDQRFKTMFYSTAGCYLSLALSQLSRISDLDSALCLCRDRSCHHCQALGSEVSILSTRSEPDVLNTP